MSAPTPLAHAKRVVLKVGSALLMDAATQDIRRAWLAGLVEDIATLRARGVAVVVVTSGAVALGRRLLQLGDRPLKLEEKQAAAACGQPLLMQAWAEAFVQLSPPVRVAQLLLTIDESELRRRYLNARNTLDTLLEMGVVPIVNENDTVATAELRFGDNDRLAARVAQMAGAEALVLFSDIDGLYTANPKQDPTARHVPMVEEMTPAIEAMAGGALSAVSSGGMITKLAAAKIALAAGCHMAICSGVDHHPLAQLLQGGRATWFLTRATPLSARKQWIAGSLAPMGSVVVDDGAAQALAQGKSLLPAGVVSVDGAFERGDAVWIKTRDGATLGRGLSAYSAADAARILGRKTAEIEAMLGYKGRDTLIHRDDMVLN